MKDNYILFESIRKFPCQNNFYGSFMSPILKINIKKESLKNNLDIFQLKKFENENRVIIIYDNFYINKLSLLYTKGIDDIYYISNKNIGIFKTKFILYSIKVNNSSMLIQKFIIIDRNYYYAMK